jgi:glycosyltransferase involved in cell wall biosynthesis
VDVLLFNHLSPVVLLGRTARRYPVVLNVDATPRLTTEMGTHYLGRTARPNLVERVKVPLYRAVYRRAAHLVVTSQLAQRSLLETYGVDLAKITVVPSSVDVVRWRRCCPAASDKLQVLFVGGDFERKGGFELLEVARLPEFSAVEFHVVTQSSVQGAPPNVVVHSGLDPASDALHQRYASASIFVLPTHADFSPIAVCEAMAMELPVIAAAVGAVNEEVDDGLTGFMVPAGDVDALRTKLADLVASAELRRQMGERGRAKVERFFDMEASAERILAVLHHAVDGTN